MIVPALCREELCREALNSHQQLERLAVSLGRLHAGDAAVVLLVEIGLDLINSRDLKPHKGITEKRVRGAVECLCCFVSVAQLKCSLGVFEFRAGKELKCDSVACNSEFLLF